MKTKKNKLTNFLKLGILFFGISLFLFNCERQDFLEPETIEVSKNLYTSKMVTLKELPKVKTFFDKEIKPNFYAKTDTERIVFFNEQNVLAIIDTLQNANYSVRFTFSDTPVGEFYNLVIGTTTEGTLKTPFILKFVCDEDQQDVFVANDYNMNLFKGSIALHKITDYFSVDYFSKTGNPCDPEFDANGNPEPCDATSGNFDGYGSGDATEGNGPSEWNPVGGDNGFGDTGNTGGGSNGLDTGSGGGGCSWDVGTTGPCDSGGSGLHSAAACGSNQGVFVQVTINCGGVKRPSAAKTTTDDCDGCITAFSGVGVNTEEDITRAISKKIESDDLDPCSNEILTDLKTLEQNDIAKILQRFGSTNSIYDWEIKTGTPTNPDNIAETDWERDSNGAAQDYEYETLVRPSYVNQATEIAIARTILHEMLHTYLISLVDDAIITGSSDATNFPLLWNALVNQTYDNSPNQLQHEIIGRKFIEPLRDALKEYDTNSQPDQYYEDLAWGALENTSTFNTLYPVGSSSRNRIINTNLAEDTNSTQSGITPESNPCN